MKKDEVQKLIQKEMEKMKNNELFDIPFHTHTGTDSPQVDPRNLLGFPTILVADATVAPTDNPPNGTFRFYYDSVVVYRLWARINNGWRYVNLT